MENEEFQRAPIYHMLIILACIAIIVAGLRAGNSIIAAFLLTFIIGIFAVPLELILVRRKVPGPLAFLIVFALVILILVVVILATSVAAVQFEATQAARQEQLAARANELALVLEQFGVHVTGPTTTNLATESFDVVSQLVDQILTSFSDLFLVIMLLFFLLIDAPSFLTRLSHSPGYNEPLIQNLGGFLRRFVGSLYVLTGVNLVQAVYIFLFLFLFGVDYAALWAFMAFLFLYIPILGLLLAAAPAIFMAGLEFGWVVALIVAAGIIVVPFTFQRIVNPRLLLSGTGLSLLVIFISVVVSTWIFGVAGLILAVPIVFTLQVILGTFPETHWLATLLSDGKEPPPVST